jgi:hypothetical protein
MKLGYRSDNWRRVYFISLVWLDLSTVCTPAVLRQQTQQTTVGISGNLQLIVAEPFSWWSHKSPQVSLSSKLRRVFLNLNYVRTRIKTELYWRHPWLVILQGRDCSRDAHLRWTSLHSNSDEIKHNLLLTRNLGKLSTLEFPSEKFTMGTYSYWRL